MFQGRFRPSSVPDGSVTLEQASTFFIRRAPGRALNPVGLLAGPIGSIATLRDYALEAQAIGRGKQLEAIIKAFGVVQPVGIRSDDQPLEPCVALEFLENEARLSALKGFADLLLASIAIAAIAEAQGRRFSEFGSLSSGGHKRPSIRKGTLG
jgi:hypothetical protein